MRRRRKNVFFKRRKGLNRGEKLCRVTINRKGLVEFNSDSAIGYSIEDIIESDKRYGIFSPKNGEYFTYRVLNEDEEITNKQVIKAIRYSHIRIKTRTNLQFKMAEDGETPDFRVEFRTVESDPDGILTANTLMYHYYPIQDPSNPFRGLCVINKAFYWTTHGERIDMHDIDPVNYPESGSGYFGKTHDLDQVYTHELLHGLGLPHATEAKHVMSSNYGIMAEFLSDQDVARVLAKYPDRNLTEHRKRRWLSWLFGASDR